MSHGTATIPAIPDIRPRSTDCSFPGCFAAAHSRGLCGGHYQHLRQGKPLAPLAHRPNVAKHWVAMMLASERDLDACVTWPFGTTATGHGNWGAAGNAHRRICELVHGTPFDGAYALHSCDRGNLGCVSPDHLRWGTAVDKLRDACQDGHPQIVATEAVVREILTSGEDARPLAARLGITPGTVKGIRQGRLRAHVAPDLDHLRGAKEFRTKRCAIEACESRADAYGLCARHYQASRTTTAQEMCVTEGCTGPAVTAGMCNTHYNEHRLQTAPPCTGGQRGPCNNPAKYRDRGLCGACYEWHSRRDLLPRKDSTVASWVSAMMADAERPDDQCVFWPFSRDRQGYGVWKTNTDMSAHRNVCRMVHGDPEGDLFALHSCGNGHLGCVAPTHLAWGTHRENVDEWVARKYGRPTSA